MSNKMVLTVAWGRAAVKTGLRRSAAEDMRVRNSQAGICDRFRCRYSVGSKLKCSGTKESLRASDLRTNRPSARCREVRESDHRLPPRSRSASQPVDGYETNPGRQ